MPDENTPDTPATPPAEDGLMAAVTAAIADATPAAVEPVDNGGDNPPADPAAPPADAPPADPPPGDNPPADPATPPADPAVPPAADPPPAKPSDEFGELDKGTPEKTRERFAVVKTKYDELVSERDAIRAERDEAKDYSAKWVDMAESTGASPEQFGQMFVFLRNLNSGTPEGLRAAYDQLMVELPVLAKALGEDAGAFYDPLADHPDLKEKVLDGMSREDAIEIARARATQQLTTQQRQAQQRQAQETQAQATAREAAQNEALADIRTFGADRKANDPDYAAKMQAIGQAGLQAVMDAHPPQRWYAETVKLYNATKVAPRDPRAAAPAGPTPQRQTTNPSAGGARPTAEPTSAEDAVRIALGLPR